MREILWTVGVGFVVGLFARAAHPGNDKLGLGWTTALGIAGAFLAKYAGYSIGWYQQGESAGFVASVIGAVVLLVAYSAYRRRKAGGEAKSS